MDRLETLLGNAREKLGCSGLRNLRDLAQMRQETLEKRLGGSQHRLTVRNTLSIYTAWLWEKAFAIPPRDLLGTMQKWCNYLWSIGCTREMAVVAWRETLTTPIMMAVPMDPAFGSLHMNINSFIMEKFPTVPAPVNKRKFAALEEGVVQSNYKIDKPRGNAPSPAAKKSKPSYTGTSTHVSVQPDRRVTRSSGRDVASNSLDHAARRDQEDDEAAWKRDGFRFDFGPSNRRAPGGGSHWSPRQDGGKSRERRSEKLEIPQGQTRQTPIKVEDRSPTPPPRVASSANKSTVAASQKRKPGWQISNVQSQLTKHAKTPATQPRAPIASKAPENTDWGTYSGSAFGTLFGSAGFQADTRQYSFGNSDWREDEHGRLSP